MTKETPTKRTEHLPLPMAFITENLRICPESPTGLRWIAGRHNRRRKPGPTGLRLNSGGYYMVDLLGDGYRAHRVVYALHTGTDPGPMQVDHIDTVKTNNHPSNLRLVSHAENQRNKPTQANNTSGVPGVAWDKRAGRWRARVNLKGSPTASKRFKDLEDAAAWVAAKRLELFGEFAHKDHPGNAKDTATAHPGPTQLGLFE